MRLLRVSRKAGRPLPRFSDDDVLDFMVAEAIVVKDALAEQKERKEAERAEWKTDRSAIRDLASKAV
jgi:hypothetical protein